MFTCHWQQERAYTELRHNEEQRCSAINCSGGLVHVTEEEDGGRRTTGATPGLVRGIARKSSGSKLEATGAEGDEATGSRGAAEVGAKRA